MEAIRAAIAGEKGGPVADPARPPRSQSHQRQRELETPLQIALSRKADEALSQTAFLDHEILVLDELQEWCWAN